MHSIVVGLHHSAFHVYLDTSAFDGCEWVETIINAPKATVPSELKGPPATLPQQPWCCCSEACFWWECWAWTRTRHKLGLIEHPFSQTDVVKTDQYSQRKVGVKEESGGEIESRRKCSNSSCVSLGLQACTQPGSDKGMAFLHILPSSGWHSSPVIGYLRRRSCFVHNDFLSPSLNYAACQFVRYLTEEHKRFIHF